MILLLLAESVPCLLQLKSPSKYFTVCIQAGILDDNMIIVDLHPPKMDTLGTK